MAARCIHHDRRIQDYQNYTNKVNFLKAIGNLTMRLLNLIKNDDRSKSSVRLRTEYIIYFYKKVRSSVRLVKRIILHLNEANL